MSAAAAIPADPSDACALPAAAGPAVARRAGALLDLHLLTNWKRIDRLFAGLLVFEWMGGIVWALCRTPRAWEGATSTIHPHVWQSVFLGAIIALFPLALAITRPGTILTRHAVAAGQMLSSALLIHISGGRIETHFHVFGSLAFLAFYRDWRVLITATVVVAVDHLLRNLFAPESVFGVLTASPWRWFEHALWVIFEDVFLVAACRQSVSEMRGIAEQRALLEQSYQDVEEKVRQRTAQLREAQDDLLKIARSAGKAEIATSVLHNVGNVLNSVNVSLRVATDKVRNSPVKDLSRASDMLGEHKGDLAAFLGTDERGKRIPEFFAAVSEMLSSEQADLLNEMNLLAKNVDHIKQIVQVQQSHAKATAVIEEVSIDTIIQDALNVSIVSADKPKIAVVRELAPVGALRTDKHAILQILINLFSNARRAMKADSSGTATLTLRSSICEHDGKSFLRLQVIDNGEGIDPANLTRIFSHGFTTHTEGHGFGLHASANSAKALGGSLSAHSDGPGRGAVFTLELPLSRIGVPA